MTVPIALIAALSQNRVIGRDNAMPWHLPEDLRHFKAITLGKPVVMGRKTFESIGRPLPGRTNIVITRRADWHHDGVTTCPTVSQALEAAEAAARRDAAAEIMVIGGAQIYARTINRARRLYLTEIATALEGDAFFPPLDRHQWRETDRRPGKDAGGLRYDFVIYERIEVT